MMWIFINDDWYNLDHCIKISKKGDSKISFLCPHQFGTMPDMKFDSTEARDMKYNQIIGKLQKL